MVLPRHVAVPIVEDLAAASVATAELEHTEEAHLAEDRRRSGADAALETVERAWELPGLELLADAPESSAAQMDLTAKGQRIRETLAHFGIGVKVARIQEGPVVTQYALDVEPGIKLSRIEGLSDNLALALAARSIRIEAPIPGEPYVGIEIPNSAFDLVTLKEVLASRTFVDESKKSKLAFALGQDVAGQPFSADLAKMPHLLIAGATGSGKSVCVNAIIDSILMNATPAEVKLILIDPKRVELAQYKGIPHLLTEVIVEPDKAVNALKWTVGTMESRYAEFASRGVRNIAGYNEALRPGQPRMPYIVIIIDELADLMMVSAYEVEATITRIAQLARATGIHLVVATQRPSVQVITGLIKANIPSRIAFAMTSGVDSRTILDTTGAEDLLGRGDMLYQPIDAPRAVRLQGVLVTDAEIEAVARHWRAQGGPQYRPEVTAPRRGGKDGRPAGRGRRGRRRRRAAHAGGRHRPSLRQGIGLAAPASPAHRLRAGGPHPRPDGGPRHRRARRRQPLPRGARHQRRLGRRHRARRGRRAVTAEGSTSSGRCCAPPARRRAWTSRASSARRRSGSATCRRSSAASIASCRARSTRRASCATTARTSGSTPSTSSTSIGWRHRSAPPSARTRRPAAPDRRAPLAVIRRQPRVPWSAPS